MIAHWAAPFLTASAMIALAWWLGGISERRQRTRMIEREERWLRDRARRLGDDR